MIKKTILFALAFATTIFPVPQKTALTIKGVNHPVGVGRTVLQNSVNLNANDVLEIKEFAPGQIAVAYLYPLVSTKPNECLGKPIRVDSNQKVVVQEPRIGTCVMVYMVRTDSHLTTTLFINQQSANPQSFVFKMGRNIPQTPIYIKTGDVLTVGPFGGNVALIYLYPKVDPQSPDGCKGVPIELFSHTPVVAQASQSVSCVRLRIFGGE